MRVLIKRFGALLTAADAAVSLLYRGAPEYTSAPALTDVNDATFLIFIESAA